MDAFDVLLVPTSAYADAMATHGSDKLTPPVDERVDLLPDVGLRIDRIERTVSELVMDECEPTAMGRGHRQWGANWGFVREPVPTTDANTWTWDPDQAIYSAVALSRLIQPNVINTQYAARVIRLPEGRLEVHPGPVTGQTADAWLHESVVKRWLTIQDAHALAALIKVYWPVRNRLPRRLSDAMWKHESAAQTRDANIRLMLVTTALQGVTRGRPNVSAAPFGELVELGALLGKPFTSGDAAEAFQLHAHLAKGGRLVGLLETLDGAEGMAKEARIAELAIQLEELLRTAVRRGIQDETFRDTFLDATPKIGVQPTDEQARALDAAYVPFPALGLWRQAHVEEKRWARESAVTTTHHATDPQSLRKAIDLVRRAAAVDTGAVEGLYDVDRGFTFTVAAAAQFWQLRVEEKGPEVRGLIEAQLGAYELTVDLATSAAPLAEAVIRRLHEEVCRNQPTYKVQTAIGPQDQPLAKGAYKTHPNHVRQADGTIHSYCPVDLVPDEMHRLVTEMNSPAFREAHPVLQAAFAHYGLVAIHPFADGNGRVARLLASVFLCRADSIPFLLLADEGKEYRQTLADADSGNLQTFVTFMLERGLEAFRLIGDAMKAVSVPPAEETAASIKRLYATKGGYEHHHVDDAGLRLLKLFNVQLQAAMTAKKLKDEALREAIVIQGSANALPPLDGHRPPKVGLPSLRIQMASRAPAEAGIDLTVQVDVPVNCGPEDEFLVRWAFFAPKASTPETLLSVAAKELLPTPRPALQMRVIMASEGLLGRATSSLHELAQQAFRKSGYWDAKQ